MVQNLEDRIQVYLRPDPEICLQLGVMLIAGKRVDQGWMSCIKLFKLRKADF